MGEISLLGKIETDDAGYPLVLTATAAASLLKREHPEVPHWMCWLMGPDPAEHALRAFTGDGVHPAGKIGSWRWERLPCAYGDVSFWGGHTKRPKIGINWTGLIRVRGAQGEDFLMFSYIRPDMEANKEYLVSTGDIKMLRRFARDVMRHLAPRRRKSNLVEVNVIGGPDFTLKIDEMEPVYLPAAMKDDIERQVDVFFRSSKLYKRMSVPYRRGFLFTGLPGTGKTMMIRNLIRRCSQEFRVACTYLSIHRNTDADDLARFFMSGTNGKPVLLVLEDLESLTHETQLTRAELLAYLDGLDQKAGVLVLATANNPEFLDAALVHRPSRFDRVWKFPLPDKALRLKYMLDTFKGIETKQAEYIAAKTAGWTFAYLKELRITAGVMAVHAGVEDIGEEHLREALKLMSDQFKAGAESHVAKPAMRDIGFVPDHDGLECLSA